MTVLITYLIVPAMSDMTSRCRIVSRVHDSELSSGAKFRPNLYDYRRRPDLWRECGLMDHKGQIVALDPSHPSHRNHMRRDEPLAAGTIYTFIHEGEGEQ